eukprot:c32500_g1_i1.p1 GENE.c32500_g1_i1~~c32500_g1_i1.p1  ORF type:complete len:178 (+),score=77.40 c32500_g1_i1:24-536(+)
MEKRKQNLRSELQISIGEELNQIVAEKTIAMEEEIISNIEQRCEKIKVEIINNITQNIQEQLNQLSDTVREEITLIIKNKVEAKVNYSMNILKQKCLQEIKSRMLVEIDSQTRKQVYEMKMVIKRDMEKKFQEKKKKEFSFHQTKVTDFINDLNNKFNEFQAANRRKKIF